MNLIYGDLFDGHTDFYADPRNETGIATDIVNIVRNKIVEMIVPLAVETVNPEGTIRPIINALGLKVREMTNNQPAVRLTSGNFQHVLNQAVARGQNEIEIIVDISRLYFNPAVEINYGKVDDFAAFRTFGCRVWVRPPGRRQHKLRPNSRKGRFLGFLPNTTKNIVWFDPETEKVKTAKHTIDTIRGAPLLIDTNAPPWRTSIENTQKTEGSVNTMP